MTMTKDETTKKKGDASSSSLRTMKPKGDLITERMASFTDRSMVAKRKLGSSDVKRIVQGKKRKIKMYDRKKKQSMWD